MATIPAVVTGVLGDLAALGPFFAVQAHRPVRTQSHRGGRWRS